MNTNTQIDKIDKVLSKISGKEMKGFVRQYAATHDAFALPMLVCWVRDSDNPNWTGGR